MANKTRKPRYVPLSDIATSAIEKWISEGMPEIVGPRHEDCLKLRYPDVFGLNQELLTFREIGERYGVGRQRAKDMARKALWKIIMKYESYEAYLKENALR